MTKNLAVLLCTAVLTAGAAEFYKADNQDALSFGSSWVGGIVPGEDDVAVWDGDILTAEDWTYVLGDDLAWHGIRIINFASESLTINNDGHTLTLGSGGLDLIEAESSFKFYLYTPLTLSAPQTWSISKATAYLYGYIAGTDPLTLTGTGWYAFYNPVTITAETLIDCVGVYLRENGSFAGPVTLLPEKNLRVNRSDAATWSQIFEERSVANNGLFMFGGLSGSTRGTVTLEEGDSLISTTSSSRGSGRVTVQLNDVIQNGGDITANWLDLVGGTFTQTQGTTLIDYVASIGIGGSVVGAPERNLTVAGGEFEARRLLIGVGNSYAYPGLFVLNNGLVKIDSNSDLRYYGVSIAAANGDSLSLSPTRDPAGILRISGGTLETPQISYGDFYFADRSSNWDVTNGFARFELRGGEVYVGKGGIGPAPAWKSSNTGNSRSETIWSGGLLAATSDFNCRTKVVLSDNDGGITIQAADADGLPKTITMQKPVTGWGSLLKTGSGALVLEGTATYTGKTTIADGTLRLGASIEPAVWSANDLVGATGTTVNSWPCSNGAENWTFTSAVAKNIQNHFTPPKVADELINGHKAVRFSGTTDALALSALATPTTPVNGSLDMEKLSVALVIRPLDTGKGSGEDIRNTAGIIGSQYSTDNNGGLWSLGLRQDGAIGAGIGSIASTWTTAWNTENQLTAGTPYVVIYTWEGKSHIEANVNGICHQKPVGNTPATLASTRIIMGINEAGFGFNGDIAEIRFYKGVCLTTQEQDNIGAELAATYGATYLPATPPSEAGTHTTLPLEANSEPEVEIPAAFAAWNTDSLAGTAGTVVNSWSDTTGTWAFNSTVAKAIHNWATSPTIGTQTIGGHKTLQFDGDKNLLAITGGGSAPTPASGATDLTVAVVLRPHGRGGVGGQGDWRSSAGIFGQSYTINPNWGLTLSANGLVGAGISSESNQTTAWSERPMFYDNDAHIAIMVWQGGDSVSINMDGTVNTVVTSQSAELFKTRIILGSNENGNCFAGEIAEIRLWQSSITLEQQNALGLELARKYSLPEEGYLPEPEPMAESSLASHEVEIAAGAELYTRSGSFHVMDGQKIRGGGKVNGELVLKSGGILEAGSNGALKLDSLTIETDGVLHWHYGANGEFSTTEVTGNVELPQGRAILSINAAGNNLTPRGVLLQYGETLTDNGTTWEIIDGSGATHVVHDQVNKQLLVKTPVGTMILIR